MTKLEFLCSDCDAKFPSPHVLAVHVIEQHHPNFILDSSANPQPPNNQPQPQNATHRSQNAPPPHEKPINLSQPPNVQALNLNPPSIVHTSEDPEVIIFQDNLQDDMENQKLTTEVVQAQLLEVKMEQKRQNDI